jgi:hypothetical protein
MHEPLVQKARKRGDIKDGGARLADFRERIVTLISLVMKIDFFGAQLAQIIKQYRRYQELYSSVLQLFTEHKVKLAIHEKLATPAKQKQPKALILPAISPSPGRSNLQEAVEDLSRFGARLCKRIATLLEDTCEEPLLQPLVMAISNDDGSEKAQLMFEGTCLRQQILNDLSNVYEMQK